MLLRSSALIAVTAVICCFHSGAGLAQSYPSRSVTIVVPLAAGTGMDMLVRVYAGKLTERLGQSFVIDNRPGASTMLGTAAVAKAPPDGHTLLVATNGALVLNPVVHKQIAYDPERDFIPVSWYVKSPFILVVNPGLPITSVRELVQYSRSANAPLTFSSAGIGSPQHLSMEFLKQRLDFGMAHVPYRNTGQAVTDIAAGHVSAGFSEAVLRCR